jgi:hypothetical protein
MSRPASTALPSLARCLWNERTIERMEANFATVGTILVTSVEASRAVSGG